MSISVFLLDDHEIVRRGIAQLLESEGDIEVVGEAGRPRKRWPASRRSVPTWRSSTCGCPTVRASRCAATSASAVSPPPACLMLTSYLDDEALFGAIIAGAAGYLLKQVDGRRPRRRRPQRRGRRLAAGPRGDRRRAEAAAPGGDPADPRYDSLSPQERRILGLIADGLTNRQIGAEMFLAEKTVKNYVSSLLHKLGFARRTEAAVWATSCTGRAATVTPARRSTGSPRPAPPRR